MAPPAPAGLAHGAGGLILAYVRLYLAPALASASTSVSVHVSASVSGFCPSILLGLWLLLPLFQPTLTPKSKQLRLMCVP
eukprot:COSAG06_NODE_43381_length_372_cov_1.307692_1_plen_79_part_01